MWLRTAWKHYFPSAVHVALLRAFYIDVWLWVCRQPGRGFEEVCRAAEALVDIDSGGLSLVR